MPTYVYACDTCGAQFEQFQRFSDEPLTTCPRCQAAVRRVFQPVGIMFKGNGWYVTDSRKTSSATTPAATNGESKTTTDSETSSKPDSTPDSTPAAPEAKPAAAPSTDAP